MTFFTVGTAQNACILLIINVIVFYVGNTREMEKVTGQLFVSYLDMVILVSSLGALRVTI